MSENGSGESRKEAIERLNAASLELNQAIISAEKAGLSVMVDVQLVHDSISSGRPMVNTSITN